MRKVSFSNEEKSLESIWSWYEDQLLLLQNLRHELISSVTSSSPHHYSKFNSFTLSEINEYFDESEKELELLTSFNIMSATEALLRVNFYKLVYSKNKSELGRTFRKIHQKKESKISLEQDIINTWKKIDITSKGLFSDYIGLIRLRDWIAHGRYWQPKLGRKYTALEAYDIAEKIFNLIK